jgi:predicted DNA-binding protein
MMQLQEEFEMPRKVAHLAAVVKGEANTRYTGVVRPVILRMPETVLSELDALASMAGVSRNSMACQLIEAAIEEVRSTLDADTVGRLNVATIQRHVAFNEQTADRESGSI